MSSIRGSWRRSRSVDVLTLSHRRGYSVKRPYFRGGRGGGRGEERRGEEEGKARIPFSGSKGPETDPERVYVSPSRLFFFLLLSTARNVQLGLTSARRRLCPSFLARYPLALETGFLSHISIEASPVT